jgi:PhzF family phenazine biosynthesis protein
VNRAVRERAHRDLQICGCSSGEFTWTNLLQNVAMEGMSISEWFGLGRVRTASNDSVLDQLWMVDAFVAGPNTGNRAGVCIPSGAVSDEAMQDLAAALRLSETAFVWPCKARWKIRWFSPSTEIDLCGHATLAAAHTLWESGQAPPSDPLIFDSAGGRLRADRDGPDISLDFPALPIEAVKTPSALIAALNVDRLEGTWRSPHALIGLLSSPDDVRQVRPDLRALKRLQTISVIVTAPGGHEPYDFVSRVFAPAVGIEEDPVTGSAHCALGPLWSQLLGRRQFLAYQASPRGGKLLVKVRRSRVTLTGRALTVSAP